MAVISDSESDSALLPTFNQASANFKSEHRSLEDPMYTQAFLAYVHKGEEDGLIKQQAVNNRGYLCPVEWEHTITNKILELSPIRQLARVQTLSKQGLIIPYNIESGWVGESVPQAQKEIRTVAFGWGKIYAKVSASFDFLNDITNLETWLAGEISTAFAQLESQSFLIGDGDSKPFGLMTYIKGSSQENKHPSGPIKTVPSGHENSITLDGIKRLIDSLPRRFHANACFATNRKTMSHIRNIKDANGDYLLQRSHIPGKPATLYGYPVVDLHELPDVAVNAHPVLFGDFKRTYSIFDQVGVRILRGSLTSRLDLSFFTTMGVGGGVLDTESMCALRIGV